jgi:nucleoside-triphosphatase
LVFQHLLLTGKPGTGKTSLVREAVARAKVKAGGFYTEEIRRGGVRQGFRLVTLDGREAVLAHVDFSSPHRVSKYRVDLDSLNRVGVSAIKQALVECDLIVVDEIGKMELLSPQFREAVRWAIDSDKRVLGTIMLHPDPFCDALKAHPKVRVITVTRENRDGILKEMVNWLTERVGNKIG